MKRLVRSLQNRVANAISNALNSKAATIECAKVRKAYLAARRRRKLLRKFGYSDEDIDNFAKAG